MKYITLLLAAGLTLSLSARERDFTIANPEANGVALAGTLAIPDNSNPKALIVLLSGSGAQDRDETIFSHKPFKALSDSLSAAGYAVARFDDRGTAKSTGDISSALTADFASDGRAVLKSLRSEKELNGIPAGYFGHSEGGYEALMLAAAADDRPDFIITFGGPAAKGRDLVLEQVYATMKDTPAEAQWAAVKPILANRYEMAASDMDSIALSEALRADVLKLIPLAMVTDELKAQIDTEVAMMASPWYRNFLRIDPAEWMRGVTVPWLAVYGSSDRQVPADFNISCIEAVNPATVTVKTLDNVNHLMQTSSTGFPTEYATNTVTLDPAVPETIVKWLEENVAK